MISYSFGEDNFKEGNQAGVINIVTAKKDEYEDAEAFFNAAIDMLDKTEYPDSIFSCEYIGAQLKSGNYTDIVKRWLSLVEDTVKIDVDKAVQIRRIKKKEHNSLSEEYLIETDSEYVILIWNLVD